VTHCQSQAAAASSTTSLPWLSFRIFLWSNESIHWWPKNFQGWWYHHFYLQQIGVDMPSKIRSHVFIFFIGKMSEWQVVNHLEVQLQQHPLQLSLPWLSFRIFLWSNESIQRQPTNFQGFWWSKTLCWNSQQNLCWCC
jgi:hypothetical protein